MYRGLPSIYIWRGHSIEYNNLSYTLHACTVPLVITEILKYTCSDSFTIPLVITENIHVVIS